MCYMYMYLLVDVILVLRRFYCHLKHMLELMCKKISKPVILVLTANEIGSE